MWTSRRIWISCGRSQASRGLTPTPSSRGLSAGSMLMPGASGTMGPADKPRDDAGGEPSTPESDPAARQPVQVLDVGREVHFAPFQALDGADADVDVRV